MYMWWMPLHGLLIIILCFDSFKTTTTPLASVAAWVRWLCFYFLLGPYYYNVENMYIYPIFSSLFLATIDGLPYLCFVLSGCVELTSTAIIICMYRQHPASSARWCILLSNSLTHLNNFCHNIISYIIFIRLLVHNYFYSEYWGCEEKKNKLSAAPPN